ncbi:MAG: TIGR04255 family protein [Deltaproteobacteria bacterium]|nr:TIGR04255 family protein [Deltaproteobacteria bacterium]
MPRIYNKPPVVEAVCEFRFNAPQPWDWTIPGLIYEKIRAEFPKKRHQNVLEVAMQPGEGKVSQEIKGGIAKMQFLREDESALVQVGPNVLSVNHLRPYPNWPTVKALIIKHLQIYQEVANPESLIRIGLRYVNRIDMPKDNFTLEDYFRALPQLPEVTPQIFASFVLRVEIPYEDLKGRLTFVFGTAPVKTENPSFMLDLDMFAIGEDVPPLGKESDWIEAAHERVEKAFDACFTEKTHKEIFEEVTQ